MRLVHVTLTDEGRKYLVHNDGVSELEAPDFVFLQESGALRFEWWSEGCEELKEALTYANGMWAGYVVNEVEQ